MRNKKLKMRRALGSWRMLLKSFKKVFGQGNTIYKYIERRQGEGQWNPTLDIIYPGNHELAVSAGTYTGSVQDRFSQQLVISGRGVHGTLPLKAELQAADRLWKMGATAFSYITTDVPIVQCTMPYHIDGPGLNQMNTNKSVNIGMRSIEMEASIQRGWRWERVDLRTIRMHCAYVWKCQRTKLIKIKQQSF